MTESAAAEKGTDIYARVTRHIVDGIERHGKLPWAGMSALPVNAATGRPYRGVNALALWVAAARLEYGSARWGTLRQWNELGGKVRRGEKSTTIVFWKTLGGDEGERGEGSDETEESRPRFVARGYPVFNAAQVEGSGEELPPEEFSESNLGRAEAFAASLGADIRTGDGTPCYHLREDYIRLPAAEHFPDGAARFAVLAHELTHWTGAASRLARDLSGRFGSESYAMEELVAELGAAFLSAAFGVTAEPRADHARYVGSWLTVLKRDARAVFAAASKAQAAADWMLARTQGLAAAA
jgi:antirestriction protein ArdC